MHLPGVGSHAVQQVLPMDSIFADLFGPSCTLDDFANSSVGTGAQDVNAAQFPWFVPQLRAPGQPTTQFMNATGPLQHPAVDPFSPCTVSTSNEGGCSTVLQQGSGNLDAAVQLVLNDNSTMPSKMNASGGAETKPISSSKPAYRDRNRDVRISIANLERELASKLSLVAQLQAQNDELKRKERVLQAAVGTSEKSVYALRAENPSGAHVFSLLQSFRSRVSLQEAQRTMARIAALTDAKDMTITDLRSWWKSLMLEVTEAFMAENLATTELARAAASAHIANLAVKVSDFLQSLFLHNRPLAFQALTTNLQTGQKEDIPRDVWVRALASLELDDGQKRDMKELAHMYMHGYNKLMEELSQIHAQFNVVGGGDSAYTGPGAMLDGVRVHMPPFGSVLPTPTPTGPLAALALGRPTVGEAFGASGAALGPPDAALGVSTTALGATTLAAAPLGPPSGGLAGPAAAAAALLASAAGVPSGPGFGSHARGPIVPNANVVGGITEGAIGALLGPRLGPTTGGMYGAQQGSAAGAPLGPQLGALGGRAPLTSQLGGRRVSLAAGQLRGLGGAPLSWPLGPVGGAALGGVALGGTSSYPYSNNLIPEGYGRRSQGGTTPNNIMMAAGARALPDSHPDTSNSSGSSQVNGSHYISNRNNTRSISTTAASAGGAMLGSGGLAAQPTTVSGTLEAGGQIEELVGKLNANMRRRDAFNHMFASMVANVISPSQKAKLIISAWPYFPSVLSLLEVLD